ncbi:MAG: phage portal protein [Phycisphaeraceae bacterium]
MTPKTPQHALPRLAGLIDHHLGGDAPRLAKRWRYYHNPVRREAGRDTPAQAEGLPDRLRPSAGRHREVVIENDIAWRVHTLVDFMFGKPVVIRSLASDPRRASAIGRLLAAVIEVNGGTNLLQDTALLGTVYGHVDVILRVRGGGPYNLADPADAASRFVIEPIDAMRGIPAPADDDYRRLEGYVLRVPMPTRDPKPTFAQRLRGQLLGHAAVPSHTHRQHRLQVWTAHQVVDLIEDTPAGGYRRLGAARNRLGRVPVVHIQNLPQPLSYNGLSEVEPLIPLQDELNTRLSDRANRITMQAFKMYLGRGIEQFTDRPISPGQMWHTDNPDASIQEFGGDNDAPSEDAHVNDIRDALDKTSGVSPVAAGVLRGRVGNLSSQNAVRLVLMGLLARIERKRVTYGAGLQRLCELVLHAADVYGVLPNAPDERRVRIDWPDPIPENQREQIDLAQRKIELGVPRQTVLNELGYGDCADQHHPQDKETTDE